MIWWRWISFAPGWEAVVLCDFDTSTLYLRRRMSRITTRTFLVCFSFPSLTFLYPISYSLTNLCYAGFLRTRFIFIINFILPCSIFLHREIWYVAKSPVQEFSSFFKLHSMFFTHLRQTIRHRQSIISPSRCAHLTIFVSHFVRTLYLT